MAKQRIAVLGLGHFGLNLSLKLTEHGAEVMGIDQNEERVEMVRDKIAHAVIMDTTDKRALSHLGLKDFDAVVVAIGEGFESSILTTAQLQELGVKKIINRVVSPIHERILRLMNLTDLILPEGEAAAHLARKMTFSGVIDHLEISSDYSLIEAHLPKAFLGKKLQEIELRRRFNLNLVTVMRIEKKDQSEDKTTVNKKVMGVPDGDMLFTKEDVLVLFGRDEDIRRFLDS